MFLNLVDIQVDEKTLIPNTNRNLIFPYIVNETLIQNSSQMIHILATCCANCVGYKMPQFKILPNLHNDSKVSMKTHHHT